MALTEKEREVLDAIRSDVQSINATMFVRCPMHEEHLERNDAKLSKHNTTLYGNGQVGLVSKVSMLWWLIVVVGGGILILVASDIIATWFTKGAS